MAHTNSTTHYSLPQFLTSDKPAWLTDINNAFSDIDTAVYNAQSKANTADTNASQALLDAADAAAAASGADAKGSGAVASLADAFQTTETYAVGDLVIYNSLLYICSVAVSEPGAWTGSTNWTRITLEGVIDDLKATDIEYSSGVNVKQAIDADRYELLWTNTTHTQDFDAQEITPNTKGYTQFLIYTKAYKNNNILQGNYCVIGESSQLNNIGGTTGGYIDNLEISTRIVTIATNSFTFTRAGTSTSGASATTDATHCIPYKIFGIK